MVHELAPEEAFALDGLLAPRKPILPNATLRIALSQFEAALRSCGIEPGGAYELVGDGPLRDRPAERVAQRKVRASFSAWLQSHEIVRSNPLLADWVATAVHQGRVHSEMRRLVEQALQVFAVLPPGEPVQRSVLAAQVLGDPHSLDAGTPLHGLLVSMLGATARLDASSSTRAVWAAWNVLVDPLSSNVAALNLPLIGQTGLAAHVRAMRGQHVILTYGQLAASDVRWPQGVPCFSCENPSVLIAAERQLGEACPPLICTAGRPSDAARKLMSLIHDAGAEIRHHGDFDQAGVQILRDLEERYGAVPWRFDVESLRAAAHALGHSLPAAEAATLEDAIKELATPLPEELVIDDLLADLSAAVLGSR